MKTLISVEPTISSALAKNPTSRNNCFELFGFDVLVDSQLKPWIIEVNVMPSLSSSSVFDKRIKTMLVCDALTLVGIKGYDKLKFHKLDITQTQLAPFQQSMTLEELKYKSGLTGSEELTRDEVEMLLELEEEFARKGNFQRVFPLVSNANFYDRFFEVKRYQNSLIQSYLTADDTVKAKLLKDFRRISSSEV